MPLEQVDLMGRPDYDLVPTVLTLLNLKATLSATPEQLGRLFCGFLQGLGLELSTSRQATLTDPSAAEPDDEPTFGRRKMSQEGVALLEGSPGTYYDVFQAIAAIRGTSIADAREFLSPKAVDGKPKSTSKLTTMGNAMADAVEALNQPPYNAKWRAKAVSRRPKTTLFVAVPRDQEFPPLPSEIPSQNFHVDQQQSTTEPQAD